MKKRYKITIDLTTDDPDYTVWCGKQNLIEDISERLVCSESDIEIEDDNNNETEQDYEA